MARACVLDRLHGACILRFVGWAGQLVQRSRGRVPDRPALLAPGRPALSYAELHALVSRTAAGLQASGIDRGSRVALVVENGPEAASAFLAIASAAAAAPLNPAYSRTRARVLPRRPLRRGGRRRRLARHAGARGGAARGSAVIDLHVDTPLRPGLPARRCEAGAPGRARPDAVALVLHTSGTTSRPKLVPLTHGQLCVRPATSRRPFGSRRATGA